MLLRGVAINRITFRTPAHRPGTRSAARATGPDDSVTRGLQSALLLPKQLDLEGTGEAAASDDQAPPPPPLRNEDDPASMYVPPAMLTMDAAPDIISAATLEQWEQAYRQMAADANQLGIPTTAIPTLPPHPSAADLRVARRHLEGIIASFLSAGL
ncbi:hypothetical protein D9Q98_006261 [Chlorella vulgaris]|uniref:Uncharacterized protein n=1 Tax=Chlorella vulgaris TaxID=3077 RepID=A0A9D4TXJ3_CHLVU|nr:hypothetical protein D9Q98_006261 [Chlorella vulgaris]